MSVLVDWTRTVEDNFVRLQKKLLGRGRELLINWVAHMASSFISSFSAQGGEGVPLGKISPSFTIGNALRKNRIMWGKFGHIGFPPPTFGNFFPHIPFFSQGVPNLFLIYLRDSPLVQHEVFGTFAKFVNKLLCHLLEHYLQ